MKYRVIISEHRSFTVEVEAENQSAAIREAYRISKEPLSASELESTATAQPVIASTTDWAAYPAACINANEGDWPNCQTPMDGKHYIFNDASISHIIDPTEDEME